MAADAWVGQLDLFEFSLDLAAIAPADLTPEDAGQLEKQVPKARSQQGLPRVFDAGAWKARGVFRSQSDQRVSSVHVAPPAARTGWGGLRIAQPATVVRVSGPAVRAWPPGTWSDSAATCHRNRHYSGPLET